MAARIMCKPMVWGLRELPEVVRLPSGKVRFRFRENDLAVAYVRTAEGTTRYIFEDRGNEWVPIPRERNVTLRPRSGNVDRLAARILRAFRLA